MDEKQEYCSNCKKYVRAANFASHNAFCQRNLVICEVCDEPVPRKQITEHEKEYHIYVKCEKCNAFVRKYEIPKHQEICPKRLVPCDYCERESFFDAAAEHVELCGSSTEMCGNYIVLKNKQKHLQAKPKVGKCTYCKTTLNDDILLFHEQECVHQPIKCQGCSAVVLLKDVDNHHCRSDKGSGKAVSQPQHGESYEIEDVIDCGDIYEIESDFGDLEDYSKIYEEKSDKSLLEFLNIPESHDFKDIRNRCEKLLNNLTIENFVSAYVLTVYNNESDLISKATDFYMNNASEIIQTSEWIKFMHECPKESCKLIIKFEDARFKKKNIV